MKPLTWIWLRYIFLKKICLLCSDKSQFQKSGDVIAFFFCTIKKNFFFRNSQVCVCVFVYLFAPALSVSAPFLLSLIASNQLIHDFCKWVIFEEKRHCGNKIFDIRENFWYPFHVIQIAAVSHGRWC